MKSGEERLASCASQKCGDGFVASHGECKSKFAVSVGFQLATDCDSMVGDEGLGYA